MGNLLVFNTPCSALDMAEPSWLAMLLSTFGTQFPKVPWPSTDVPPPLGSPLRRPRRGRGCNSARGRGTPVAVMLQIKCFPLTNTSKHASLGPFVAAQRLVGQGLEGKVGVDRRLEIRRHVRARGEEIPGELPGLRRGGRVDVGALPYSGAVHARRTTAALFQAHRHHELRDLLKL